MPSNLFCQFDKMYSQCKQNTNKQRKFGSMQFCIQNKSKIKKIKLLLLKATIKCTNFPR